MGSSILVKFQLTWICCWVDQWYWMFIEVQCLITNCIDCTIGHRFTYPWNSDLYSVHENWYPKINETTEQYTEHCTCRLFWLNHKLAKLFPLKRNNALSHDDFHKMQLKHRIHTSEVSQNLIWDISINNNNSLDQVISMSLSTQQGEMIVLFPSFWHVGFAERSQRN